MLLQCMLDILEKLALKDMQKKPHRGGNFNENDEDACQKHALDRDYRYIVGAKLLENLCFSCGSINNDNILKFSDGK